MKTKIIASVLAAVLLLHVGGEFTRAKATGAAVAGIAAIGILAFNLLGVMTGQYDDTAEGISCFIENGVDGWQKAFVGTENTPSWFASGWQQIYDTCSGWFDSGEITISDDGEVSLTYEQYCELCKSVLSVSDFSISLGNVNGSYMFLSSPFGIPLTIKECVKLDSFYKRSGMSYVPILYSDSEIYFSDYFFYLQLYDYSSTNTQFKCQVVSAANNNTYTGQGGGGVYISESKFYSNYLYKFYYNISENKSYIMRDSSTWYLSGGNFYKYSNQTFETVTLDDILSSGTSLKTGYLACDGKFNNFKSSISTYVPTPTADIDDLSDTLKPVLDKTTNPTLVIDTDPAIVNPIDSVTVTDIPGTNDVPLSQLKEKTKVDIDIPSLIADKFPFCIPFDFIRIISVLCADPVAPVFRIPISTNPENLEAFDGNQTIGDVPEDFKPMFEIDEEIVIDLSCIPLVQPICYTVFILGFVILLIYITPKMINH